MKNMYIEKCEELLEKQALNRLTKEIIQNRGSFTKDKLRSLYEAGSLRSPLTISRGHKLRDNQIKKQLGVTSHVPKSGSGADVVVQSAGGAAYNPASNQVIGNTKGVIRSHELSEAVEFHNSRGPELVNRYLKKLPKETAEGVKQLDIYNHEVVKTYNKLGKSKRAATVALLKGDASAFPFNSVGQHKNIAVLGHESNSLRVNPYSHVTPAKVMGNSTVPEIRTNVTGEAGLVNRLTGKKFMVDKMTNKDLHKLRTAKPDGEITHSNGITQKFFDTTK